MFPFELDPFQVDGIAALRDGHSVLVVAPTGTGKTVLAEAGIADVLERGRRAVYTAPLKALSNEKARLFGGRFGPERVGVLTGDVALNPDAPLRVMTTEILRNMLLAGDSLADTDLVVFDEFHYLADRERGSVWEEALVLLPRSVQVLCLSATAPNAQEIADWLTSLRGPVAVVRTDRRPVPLTIHYYNDGMLKPIVDAHGRVIGRSRAGGEALKSNAPRVDTALPEDVLQVLAQREMLPCFYFVFSRRRVEDLAWSCRGIEFLHRGRASNEEIRRALDASLAALDDDARTLPQTAALEALLPYGIGFHHAGLLPTLKDLVERLFAAGHLGVIFTTDTMALGVNMPARTVVVERLTKFDGIGNRSLTGREFQQIIGRAGRRGIDQAGHAVLLSDPWVPYEEVERIATQVPEPIESAFRLDDVAYLNLRRTHTPEGVAALVARSLRLFQQQAIRERRIAERARMDESPTSVPSGRGFGGDPQDPLIPGGGVGDQARREARRRRLDAEIARLDREIGRDTRREVEGREAVLQTFGYLPGTGTRGLGAASAAPATSPQPLVPRQGGGLGVSPNIPSSGAGGGRPIRGARWAGSLGDALAPNPGWAEVFRSIFHEAAFPLSEFLRTEDAAGMSPEEWAEIASWYAIDQEPRANRERQTRRPSTARLSRAWDSLWRSVIKIRLHQSAASVEPAPAPNPWYVGLVWGWARGAGYGDLCRRYDLDPGDLTGLLADTIGLLRQIEGAARTAPPSTLAQEGQGLARSLRAAQVAIWRGPVTLQLAGRVAPPVLEDVVASARASVSSRRGDEPDVRLVTLPVDDADCRRCRWYVDAAAAQKLRRRDAFLPAVPWCAHPETEVGEIARFSETVRARSRREERSIGPACPEFDPGEKPTDGQTVVAIPSDLAAWERWRQSRRDGDVAVLRPRVHAAMRRASGRRKGPGEDEIVNVLRRFVVEGAEPAAVVAAAGRQATPRVQVALLENVPVRPLRDHARVPSGEERTRALRGWARALPHHDALRREYDTWTDLAAALTRADHPSHQARSFGDLTRRLRSILLAERDGHQAERPAREVDPEATS